MRLKNLTYHDWLEHAFGHEVRFHQAAWFFDHDRDWWDPEPAVALAYLTRLFEGPEPLIRAHETSRHQAASPIPANFFRIASSRTRKSEHAG